MKLYNFVFFIIMLALCGGAHADDFETLSEPAQQTYELVQSELDTIESQIQQINPEIVSQNQDKSDEEKLVIYRSYLAQQTYELYERYFKNRIEKRSKQTGRTVKHDQSTPEKSKIWLDRGNLDSDECQATPGNRVGQCAYPDGFEDVWMRIEFNDNKGQFLFYEDNKAENKTQTIRVQLRNRSDTQKMTNNIVIKIFTYEYDYKKYSAWRESDRAYYNWMGNMNKKDKKEFVKQLNDAGIDERDYQQANIESFPFPTVTGETFRFKGKAQ